MIFFRLWQTAERSRQKDGHETDKDRGLGHLLPRKRCLPRPSPYGSPLSMRFGTTSDSIVITNEDTLLVQFSLFLWCSCVLTLPDCCRVSIFNSTWCLSFPQCCFYTNGGTRALWIGTFQTNQHFVSVMLITSRCMWFIEPNWPQLWIANKLGFSSFALTGCVTGLL